MYATTCTQVGLFAEVWTKIKMTAVMLVSVKHLLVVLMPLYNGAQLGFVYAEMTRAFSSCVLGLDKVS